MSRILIHIPMAAHGEYDIFSQFNHEKLLQFVSIDHNGVCPNLGNRLWFQGIISAIDCIDNQLEYFSPDMSKEYINDNFDLIVAPMANIFSKGFVPILWSLEERFREIKIPVYVIACGVQADSYDQLNAICNELRAPASAFISSVYNTGGEFALRGYFTKEFFDRLGFPSAVVTGCPSMFQMGRYLHISEEKVEKEEFRPLLNGDPSYYSELFSMYENAEFFDQSIFFHELWDPAYLNNNDHDCLKKLIERFGIRTTTYLLQDRIKLIPDMNIWREYLIHKGFSLSYGSRIHGSIMPILAGIPAVLEVRDARTKEMAEFFHIPCVSPGEYKNYKSLYELYRDIDYHAFNLGFVERYNNYEQFLKKHKIVRQIREENQFFHPIKEIPAVSVTRERRSELFKQFVKEKKYWNAYDRLYRVKQRIARYLG